MSAINTIRHEPLSNLARKHLDKPIEFVIQRKNGYPIGDKDAQRLVGTLESFSITDRVLIIGLRSSVEAKTSPVVVDLSFMGVVFQSEVPS